MSLHVMNRQASSLKSPFSNNNGNGQVQQQNAPFLQRIHKVFSGRIAAQIVQAYNCLNTSFGRRCSEHLRSAEILLEHYSVYAEFVHKLHPILVEDALCLDLLKEGIHRLLTRHNISSTVQGRTKGIYSLYRKMCRQQQSVEVIMDCIGLRIDIVASVQACYQVLGLLHTHFRPIPGTFDDYIGCPKANGYQSLHTCIYPVPHLSHKPVEIQIRTDVMHREAEFGIAVHWRYKRQEEVDVHDAHHLDWLRNLQISSRYHAPHTNGFRLDEFSHSKGV